jgi:anaerobic magnesium-protoporphyrin IX monomethyl ester cyclase
MEITLIFPPFTWPISPPLGIAQLKSFINAGLNTARADCIDLNIIYHNLLFEEIACIATPGQKEFSELIRAYHLFKGGESDQFFNKEAYNTASERIFNYLHYNHKSAALSCKKFVTTDRKDKIVTLLEVLLEGIIKNYNPDMLGLSVLFSSQLYSALAIAKLVKLKYKNIKVILGGGYLNSRLGTAISKFKVTDRVIIGEGENQLFEFISRTQPGHAQLPVKDLSKIPFPDFSDFDPGAYFTPRVSLPLLTARGCYWRKCAFCSHFISYGRKYAVRSMESIMEEFQYHINNGISHFSIVDEMISAKRFNEISSALIDNNIKIAYTAYAKPTNEFSPSVLKKMADSGCKAILWGLESANQRVLDLMSKGTAVNDIQKTLKDSSKAGIKNHVFIITGFPTETRSEFFDTLSFLFRNRKYIDAIHNSVFALSWNTKIFNEPEKFGISGIHQRNRWREQYDYEVTSGMSQKEIHQLAGKCLGFFKCFSAWSYYLNFFRDHALILYSEMKNYEMKKDQRNIKECFYLTMASV